MKISFIRNKAPIKEADNKKSGHARVFALHMPLRF
jgi:hypothetical protein